MSKQKYGQFSILGILSVGYRDNEGEKQRFSFYCGETVTARTKKDARKTLAKTLMRQYRKFRKRQPSAKLLGSEYSVFELSAETLRRQAKLARPRSQIKK